jgi:Methyltransferase domain
MEPNPRTIDASDQATAGAAVYSQFVLSVYDLLVLGISNRWIWKCPSQLMLDFYNAHISDRHLDIGVGTGYFLDKCNFPSPHPTLALLDLNPNSLQTTAERLRRYSPTTHLANVLEPLPVEPAGFDSIALNYLLHCLPGSMLSKGGVFRNLRPLLGDRGKVFGTTILGQGVEHNWAASRLMHLYNSKGIFGNINDSAADLERILKDNFRDYSLDQVGCVAFFVGQN